MGDCKSCGVTRELRRTSRVSRGPHSYEVEPRIFSISVSIWTFLTPRIVTTCPVSTCDRSHAAGCAGKFYRNVFLNRKGCKIQVLPHIESYDSVKVCVIISYKWLSKMLRSVVNVCKWECRSALRLRPNGRLCKHSSVQLLPSPTFGIRKAKKSTGTYS